MHQSCLFPLEFSTDIICQTTIHFSSLCSKESPRRLQRWGGRGGWGREMRVSELKRIKGQQRSSGNNLGQAQKVSERREGVKIYQTTNLAAKTLQCSDVARLWVENRSSVTAVTKQCLLPTRLLRKLAPITLLQATLERFSTNLAEIEKKSLNLPECAEKNWCLNWNLPWLSA